MISIVYSKSLIINMNKYVVIFLLSIFPLLVSAQVFERDLEFGMQDDTDITKLQEFLTDEGIYSGPITGNFFSLTLKAVKKFQQREGITPAAGYFGPKTRMKVNAVFSTSIKESKDQAVAEGVNPTLTPIASFQTTQKNQLNVMSSIMEQIVALQKQIDLLLKKNSTANTIPPTVSTPTTPVASNTHPVAQIQPSITQPTQQQPNAVSQQNQQSAIPAVPATPSTPAVSATPAQPSQDITAPIISGLTTINITENSATITWVTNEPSDSKIYFSTASPIPATTTATGTDTNYVTNHGINIANLIPSKNYYYIVVSKDASGNTTTSNEQSFTTLEPTPIPSPSVTSLNLSDVLVSSFGQGLIDTKVGGIAFDSLSNVYITDTNGHEIIKFDSSGNFIKSWGSGMAVDNVCSNCPDGYLAVPYGIAVDSSNNVYVVEANDNRIQKFDSNGNFVAKWNNISSHSNQGPVGLAFDNSSTNLYVTTMDNFVHILDKNIGSQINSWSSGNGGITIDSANSVYVVGWSSGIVQKFNTAGNLITKFGNITNPDSEGREVGQFDRPAGVAVDRCSNIYVADRDNNRIQVFDESGNIKYIISGNSLYDPFGLGINGQFLYVGDRTANQNFQNKVSKLSISQICSR